MQSIESQTRISSHSSNRPFSKYNPVLSESLKSDSISKTASSPLLGRKNRGALSLGLYLLLEAKPNADGCGGLGAMTRCIHVGTCPSDKSCKNSPANATTWIQSSSLFAFPGNGKLLAKAKGVFKLFKLYHYQYTKNEKHRPYATAATKRMQSFPPSINFEPSSHSQLLFLPFIYSRHKRAFSAGSKVPGKAF